jgi:hypothetical protein
MCEGRGIFYCGRRDDIFSGNVEVELLKAIFQGGLKNESIADSLIPQVSVCRV